MTIIYSDQETVAPVYPAKADQTHVRPESPQGIPDRPVPLITIRRYAHAALELVSSKQYEDGAWYVQVPGLPGVWAEGPTNEDARRELEDVIFQWCLLKLEDGDDDFPILAGTDLNALY